MLLGLIRAGWEEGILSVGDGRALAKGKLISSSSKSNPHQTEEPFGVLVTGLEALSQRSPAVPWVTLCKCSPERQVEV